MAKYDLLCYTASHTDVHLCQKLRASLTPAIILWKHGHLTRKETSTSAKINVSKQICE